MVMEGTQVVDKQKDVEVVEAWLRAEKAPEPGTIAFDQVIKDPELPAGVGMKFISLQSAGWVYVYHQKTGDKSIVNKNMLRQQLQKKLSADEGGGYAFSLFPPKDKAGNVIKPISGAIKCMLHKDSLNREHYSQLGFGVCPKSNITSQHSLVQHMKHRHHIEFETIEKERIDAEKAQEKLFQQALYNKLVDNIQPVVPNSSPPQPVVVTPSPAGDEAYLKKVERMAKAREAKKNKK